MRMHKSKKRVPAASRRRNAEVLHNDRRGSAILIVLSLMGMLLLLGIVFYTSAAQERSNAQFFLESEQYAESRDRDYFDYALEQLIIGPKDLRDPRKRFEHVPINSALSGKRHALISNALGSDNQPFNGQGINLIENPTNASEVFVDQNFNNTDDLQEPSSVNFDVNRNGIHDFYEINDSPSAHGVYPQVSFPEPDVDYTYPDINNTFLAFKTVLPDGRTVIIPSFHRPQYLRDIPVAGIDTDNDNNPDKHWWDAPTTRTRVFRPHPEHTNFDGDDDPTNNIKRYLTQAEAVALGLSNGFPFKPQTVTSSGSDGRQGVWSQTNPTAALPAYEYDVDNDGDDIPEGIWIDLDHPVQETPDGKKFIPLFSFTVYDADGLVNLNTAGKVAKLPNNPTNLFTNPPNSFISKSLQGLDPSEVNPQWAMLGGNRLAPVVNQVNGTAPDFTDYKSYFNRDPVAAPVSNWQDIANMELWLMLMGRIYDDAGTRFIHPGRYGEPGLSLQAYASGNTAQFPFAGLTNVDDNGNIYEGGIGFYRFGHPMAWNGLGRMTRLNGSNLDPRRPNFVTPAGAGANQWLQYVGYQMAGDGSFDQTGTYRLGAPTWDQANNFNLIQSVADINALTDEAMEATFRDFHRDSTGDELFGVAEMDLLHLRHADLTDPSAPESRSMRLSDLMPYSFSTEDSKAELRQRFTTVSWDRRNYGFATSPLGFERSWEVTKFDFDQDGSPEDYFPPLFGEADLDLQNRVYNPNKIPPYTVNGTGVNTAAPFVADVSPFRGPLRRLLGDLRMKMSVNHLVTYSDGRVGGDPNRREPRLRRLTPHPLEVEQGFEELPGGGEPTYADLISNNLGAEDFNRAQEYWARVDRQCLCRDIFVLLYTFGGGDSRINAQGVPVLDYSATSNANNELYSDEQLFEMAQFAVNLVDSMDPDEVTTMFEYDVDLFDGWNLGDRSWSTEDDDDPAQRRVVFGVEAQQLTISEVLTVTAKQVTNNGTPQDFGATEWNDTQDNFFHYLELQNLSPNEVNLQGYQFRFIPQESTPVPGTERRMSFLSDGSYIPAGQTFTIGASQQANVIEKISNNGADQDGDPYSELKVDPDFDPAETTVFSNLQSIAPFQGTTNTDTGTNPLPDSLDFDIVRILHEQRAGARYNTDFVFEKATGTNETDPGEPVTQNDGVGVDTVQWLSGMTITTTDVTVEVWRRLNPRQIAPSPTNAVAYKEFEQSNPWVRVDAVGYKPQIMEFDANDDANAIKEELRKQRSWERREALDRSTTQEYQGTTIRPNSLTARNNSTVQNFNLWHAHFDREFGSIGEILNVPVFSPMQLTAVYSEFRNRMPLGLAFGKFFSPQHPENQNPGSGGGGSGPGNGNGNGTIPPGLSGSRGNAFGVIDRLNNGGGFGGYDTSQYTADSWKKDSLWHRLFGFVEVPSRVNRHVEENILTTRRLPGKINVNTLRHPEVLAGLLDDASLVDLQRNFNPNPFDNTVALPSRLSDQLGDNDREWWREFLKSRDGESFNAPRIPGTPLARPFRDLTFARRGIDSVEDTIFRSLPVENNLLGRRLWEVGTNDDLNGSESNVTHWMRHRHLGKVMNNVTTRSNTFVVFITVKLFEVHEEIVTDNSGNERRYVQIGGAFHPNGDQHDSDMRGMFVIDRSRLEDGYDPESGRFDWQNFVMHRLLIEDNLR